MCGFTLHVSGAIARVFCHLRDFSLCAEPILSSGTPTSPPFPQRLNLEMRLLALAPWSPALDCSSSDEPPPEVLTPTPPTAEADAADDALAKVFERSAWWLAARGAGDPARASATYCRESR